MIGFRDAKIEKKSIYKQDFLGILRLTLTGST